MNIRNVALLVQACESPRARQGSRHLPVFPSPASIDCRVRRFAPGHRQIVFNWDLDDRDMRGRGDGAARIASPDSARLDFFLGGSFAGGAALLIRRFSRRPRAATWCEDFIPPAALLWAALGSRGVA